MMIKKTRVQRPPALSTVLIVRNRLEDLTGTEVAQVVKIIG